MMKKLKVSLVVLLLLGILIGTWMFFSVSTFLILLLILLILLVIKHHLPIKDRSFIIKIITIAFILRIVFIIFYYNFYLLQGNPDILGPDGEVYSQRGWYISRLLLNQNPYIIPDRREYIFNDLSNVIEFYREELPPVGEYQIGLSSYLIGILYAIFGYTPLMIKLINSSFSAFTGVLIYFIGREIFNSKVGKISMTLFIFLPSIFIFSVTGLKDAVIIFLLTAIIWLMIKFQKRTSMLLLILTFVTAFTVGLLRIPFRYPLLLLIGLSLLLSLKIGILKKCFIIIIAVLVIFLIPASSKKVKKYLDPDQLFSIHIGYVNTPGNNYRIFPERCYYQSQLVGIGPIEILGAFMKGSFHLLAEPLPYRIKNKSLFFAFPQTILLYLFMPFIIIGAVIGFRYKKYEMIPIALYLIMFILLIAIGSGNVGTVFRHRDMIMPFLIILGSAGFYAIFQKNNSTQIN